LSQRIAFFDFDGTITTKDTLLEIIKYQRGTFRFYLGFLLNSPYLVAYKLKFISNQAAKERMLRYFFRKTPVEQFQQRCDAFAATIIPGLIRPKAIMEIEKLLTAGAEVVIVSASAGNWIRSWCNTMQVKLISTKLEVVNGAITGKINGRNCHGQEKVRRITASYDLSAYHEIYCYGDTEGDKPMLQLATFAFYKPFR
jgi:phosphatidylglycerophosphatase C